MIGILDYGMGNLRSVEKALQSLGASVQITPELTGFDKLIIPGVGAFGAAMRRLGGLRDGIRGLASSGMPILGICLGEQLLFDYSEELGGAEGLGLLPGTVKYFPADAGIKVPHIGWNALHYTQQSGLAEGADEGEQVYFVHSLVAVPEDQSVVAAEATHGAPFVAMVQKDNIWGAQFHPEKSGKVGLRMLQRFIDC